MNVIDVSKYCILYCRSNGCSINNLKLQKLLYFVQAQFLVNARRPAFEEEIEAWDIGPVVPESYHFFNVFGNSQIPIAKTNGIQSRIYTRDKKLMDAILKQCAVYSNLYLAELIFNQKPWKNAYCIKFNKIITKESLEEYFR